MNSDNEQTDSSSDEDVFGPEENVIPIAAMPGQDHGPRPRKPPAWLQSGEWDVG